MHGCLNSASTRVPIVAACLSPDARLIFAASLNAVVYAVDARTQQVCGELALASARAAATGPVATGAAAPDRQPVLALAAVANGARGDGLVDFVLLVGGADGSIGAWHAALTVHDEGADGGPRLRFAPSDFGGLANVGAAVPAGALAVRPTEAPVTCLTLAAAPHRQLLVGDADGRLALLRLQLGAASAGARSPPRRAETAAAEPVLGFLSSSDALAIESAARGDLASGGVSGIAACRLFARGAGPGGCTAAAASSDGRVALFCTSADALLLWPSLVVTTGEVLRCVCAVGGSAVATGGNDGCVRLWDVEAARKHGAGGPPIVLASDEARCVRLSPAQPMPADAVARSEWLCSLACGGGTGAEPLLLIAGRRTGEALAWAAQTA
jgi:WD40 repeat protein